MIKTTYRIIVFIFLIANFLLIVAIQNSKNEFKNLKKLYISKCNEEEFIRSTYERSLLFQGNYILFKDSVLWNKLREKKFPIPLVVINQHVCSSCLDVLLLELENLNRKTLSSFLNRLSIIVLSDREISRFNDFSYVFKKQFSIYQINVKNLVVPNLEKLPDISVVLIDQNMKIMAFCEFSAYYPFVFSHAVKMIGQNFN